MKFDYVGPSTPGGGGQRRWKWVCRGWPDGRDSHWLFGLRNHQSMAYAAFWRRWNGGRK